MKKLAIILFITSSAFAQTQITTTIGANQAASVTRVAVPFPDLASGIDAAQVNQAFFAPLTRDIAASGVFAIAPLPPNVAITADLLKRINAMNLLKLTVATEKDDFVVGARLSDTAGGEIFGKQYRGPAAALTKTAHMIADAMVRAINGKPGIFLSQIAFASNRDGASEIYLMDWDGGNQRRITYHNGLSILPSWSPDCPSVAVSVVCCVGATPNATPAANAKSAVAPRKRRLAKCVRMDRLVGWSRPPTCLRRAQHPA